VKAWTRLVRRGAANFVSLLLFASSSPALGRPRLAWAQYLSRQLAPRWRVYLLSRGVSGVGPDLLFLLPRRNRFLLAAWPAQRTAGDCSRRRSGRRGWRRGSTRAVWGARGRSRRGERLHRAAAASRPAGAPRRCRCRRRGTGRCSDRPGGERRQVPRRGEKVRKAVWRIDRSTTDLPPRRVGMTRPPLPPGRSLHLGPHLRRRRPPPGAPSRPTGRRRP